MLKNLSITDLVGDYSIIGSNQDETDETYKGTLNLTIDNNNRIIAKWLIQNTQKQYGTGFFKDNILVINFNYLSDDNKTYKGVVVYRCISNEILDGFWSEEFGDPAYLGKERCFKIKEKTIIN
ncbi:hypothetical protein MKD41_04545 [Lutibacter sp. A64]|uniref:hypothetical protein n=1 Tax=Lutibacter sp. A64 TaxID=2918526 RepID=UPI001F056BDF|nr:hypothetical protein [Lutibacter sp. A64]UMB54742.1 hypothetical protein MKD41_04545 [Lutibacter sp. A64]